MRSLVRRYRTLSRDPLLVLAAVLVALLGFALLRVDWPLSYRMFAVGGSAVGVHPDGRVLVGHAHAISIVDPQKGAVTATIPLGLLTPRGGLVGVPGTSQAQTLTTMGGVDTVTTVDLDAVAVALVRAKAKMPADDRVFLAAGVDHSGNLINRISGRSAQQAVGLGGLVWTGAQVSALPGVGGSFEVLSTSPDRTLLYAAGRGRVLVIESASHRIRSDLTLPSSTWEGTPYLAPNLLLTADGEHIITGDRYGVIAVRTLAGDVVTRIDIGGDINGFALSPDGATLYAVLDDRMLAVDVSGYA